MTTKQTTKSELYPSGWVGAALLALRLFIGFAFVMHGWTKISDISGFADAYGLPYVIAVFTVYSQLIGGVLIMFGLLTKYVYPAVGGSMIGAIIVLIGRGVPFISIEGQSWELEAFYALATHALSLLGAGAYSLDELIYSRKQNNLNGAVKVNNDSAPDTK